MAKSDTQNVAEQFGAAVGDLIHGTAAFFQLDSLAQQSLRKICEWAGVKDLSALWKFGTVDQMINWVTSQLKNSKLKSGQVLSKIQMQIDKLPPALSQNMANVVNQKSKELTEAYKKANVLQQKAEQAEMQAQTAVTAQAGKLSGDRIFSQNTMADQTAEAKRAYQSIYELGKDY